MNRSVFPAAIYHKGSLSRGRRAFTLIEMLVVMAITVILLGLIFGPIISSFNFVSRADQTAEAQEEARRLTEQVTREVKDALQVGVSTGDLITLTAANSSREYTRGVREPGYINAYDDQGNVHELAGALLDFMPADDTLGLHGGHLVNPPRPQETDPNHTHESSSGGTVAAKGIHNIIVRYFVGLKDPGFPHSNSSSPDVRYLPRGKGQNPLWSDSHISNNVLGGSNVDNPYVLYRIEFDPDDPAFSNWAIPDPNYRGPGPVPYVVNPDFFYDNTPAPPYNVVPFWANWRRNAVAQTRLTDIDLVRFARNTAGAVTDAQSTVTFTPTVVQNDAAVPSTGQQGSSPVTYVATHGNWTGVQNNGTLTTANFNPPAIGIYPHILVYSPQAQKVGNDALLTVFDNWDTNRGDPAYPGNSRVLTWDSRTGAVHFMAGITGTNGAQEIDILAPLGPTDNGWYIDALSLAAAKGLLTVPPSLRKFIQIVPGSEVVKVIYQYPSVAGDPTSPPTTRTDIYSLNSSNRTMDTPPQPASWDAGMLGPYPATLPEPGTYTFDTVTGAIILGFPWPGPNNPLRPQPIPKMYNGQPPQISIHFAYQTNLPNDLVRVDYATRSLLNVNMGIRMFDPSTSRPILVQLSDKASMRNIGR